VNQPTPHYGSERHAFNPDQLQKVRPPRDGGSIRNKGGRLMDTIPVLTIHDVQEIDKGGNILSQHGTLDVGDASIVSALAAGSFAATRELARRIGEQEFSALYNQGVKAHLLMQSVDDNAILVTVFGPQTTVGLVRFYSARVTTQLAAILARIRARPRESGFTFDSETLTQAGAIFKP
jgi:predicted regulator of Ras-like GTPase activity (Roadblock/LC7/MglB family)